MTKTSKIILSIVVVALLIFGFYTAFKRNSKENIAKNNNPTVTATTTTDGAIINVQGAGGGYTIEQVPVTDSKGVPKPIPDLSRPITTNSGVIITAEAKTAAIAKIKSLQTLLKKDSSNNLNWIDLGIYQKQAGDYDGAVISWQYASKLSPKDYVSVGNLGNLYAYYLKNNTQAEIYYKQAISRGPKQVYLYVQLAEIYRDIFKDMDKARAIVDQGLVKIPNDPNLLQLKASLSASN